MKNFNLKFNFVMVILILIFIIPLVSSQETISGVEICGIEIECGPGDGICPTDYDPLKRPCNVIDPDCENNDNYIEGLNFCTEELACTSGDRFCPSKFDPLNRLCYTIDNDCKQCELNNITVSSAFDPVNNNDLITLSALVFGDNCDNPNYLELEMYSEENENCFFTLKVSNPIHNYVNSSENAQGLISGSLNINFNNIPSACSEKEVQAIQDSGILSYQNFELNSDADGSLILGELDIGVVEVGCEIIVKGHVNDTSGNSLKDVSVKLKKNDGSYENTTLTNSSGHYHFLLKNINFEEGENLYNGDYQLRFTKLGYAPHINYSVELECEENLVSNVQYNATLFFAQTLCQNDCTMVGSNICDRRCDGFNSCEFKNQSVRNICDPTDNPNDGALKGHIIDNVLCCTGDSSISSSNQVDMKVPSNIDNVVKTTRIVFLNGQPVKLNIVVFN
jgi:5-hydroxyisourate hydrolase-like protein (transthyretin family)